MELGHLIPAVRWARAWGDRSKRYSENDQKESPTIRDPTWSLPLCRVILGKKQRDCLTLGCCRLELFADPERHMITNP